MFRSRKLAYCLGSARQWIHGGFLGLCIGRRDTAGALRFLAIYALSFTGWSPLGSLDHRQHERMAGGMVPAFDRVVGCGDKNAHTPLPLRETLARLAIFQQGQDLNHPCCMKSEYFWVICAACLARFYPLRFEQSCYGVMSASGMEPQRLPAATRAHWSIE